MDSNHNPRSIATSLWFRFAAQITPDFVVASPGFLATPRLGLISLCRHSRSTCTTATKRFPLRYKQFFRSGAGCAMKCLNTRNIDCLHLLFIPDAPMTTTVLFGDIARLRRLVSYALESAADRRRVFSAPMRYHASASTPLAFYAVLSNQSHYQRHS